MTPAPAKGEFNNFCTEGLASGQLAKTDCSVNWTDSDGRIYCFSSEDSKAAFLKDPAGNLQKAREFFASKQASAGKATKEFTEDDVNKRVQEVIAERSKDGAFVFHDPKLDADLNLLFEQIKMVRGMEGYGWFANVIFHDKDEAKKQYAIDFWFKPEGDQLTLMDIQSAEGTEAGRRQLLHGHTHAGRLVVAAGAGASRRYGGDPRLAGDERDPQLHSHA